jgi:hypothetical protein
MHTTNETFSLTSMMIALVVMNLLFIQQMLTYVF